MGGQYGGAESRPWVEEELGGAAWEEEELAQPGGHPATTRHAARSSSVEAATIQSIHPINLFFSLVQQVLLALSGRVAVFGEQLGIGFARERSPAQAGLP